MKVIEARKTTLQESIKAAKRGRVVLTEEGKPIAVISPVTDLDRTLLKLQSSPVFWRRIAEARLQPSFSHDEVVKVFGFVDDGTLSRKDLQETLNHCIQARSREDFWQMIGERRKKKATRGKRAKP